MSTPPSKNSSKEAPEGSQSPSRKGAGSGSPDAGNTSKEKPDDGKKVFKPKDLKIRWHEDSQYWSIPEGDGPAELLAVCWLDVSGEMPVTKGKAYEVSFMLSMNTKNSFGWDDLHHPVMVMARIGKEGEYQRKEIKLSELKGTVMEFPPDKCRVEFKSDEKSESKEELPAKTTQTKSKSDENPNNDEEKLYFGLYEVWSNKWKGGLQIHEAIVQEIAAHDDSISTSENLRSSRSSRST